MESQVNLVDLVLMPLIAFIAGMLMVLLMRKIAARLQRRLCPIHLGESHATRTRADWIPSEARNENHGDR